MERPTLLLALLLSLGPAAAGERLHVDAVNGADSGDGSEASPFATLGAALAIAGPGDEIAAAAGLYEEEVAMQEGVALVGSGAVIAGAVECAAARLAGFTLEGPVGCAAAAHIERNVLRGGLHVAEPGGARVEGNLFVSHALEVSPGASALVVGNTFYASGGIRLSEGASATIANNLLASGVTGIRLDGEAEVEIRHNDVFGNGFGIIGFDADYVGLPDQTGLAGNLSADPGFVDAADADFRLRPGSPLVDAGSSADAALAEDLDGTARLLDGDGDMVATVDIGAQELDPAEELPLDVAVDLLPGESPNEVKLRWVVRANGEPGRRALAFAVLSDAELSAPDEIDPATLRVEDAAAERCRAKDVDRDGRDDLRCRFPAGAIGLVTFPFELPPLCVRGATFGGRRLLGCDEVEVVP